MKFVLFEAPDIFSFLNVFCILECSFLKIPMVILRFQPAHLAGIVFNTDASVKLVCEYFLKVDVEVNKCVCE